MISHIQKYQSKHGLITSHSRSRTLRIIDDTSLDSSGDANHARIEPFTFSNYCKREQSASHGTSNVGYEESSIARDRRERIISEEEEEEICAIVERCLRSIDNGKYKKERSTST